MISSNQKLKNISKFYTFRIELINQKQEEKLTILSRIVIQPWYLDPSLLKFHKLYHQIFLEIPDKILPKLVREFYLNLRVIGFSLITYMKGAKISIHNNHFVATFEVPYNGITYTLDKILHEFIT